MGLGRFGSYGTPGFITFWDMSVDTGNLPGMVKCDDRHQLEAVGFSGSEN